MDKIKSKLLKIKRLAESGSLGEREAAMLALERALKKYDIESHEISEDEILEYSLGCDNEIEKKLCYQVIISTMSDDSVLVYTKDDAYGRLFFQCSYLDYIEVGLKYDIYKSSLSEEMDIFYEAFVHKNRIFPSVIRGEQDLEDDDEKDIDLNRINKMKGMMSGIDAAEINKRIS